MKLILAAIIGILLAVFAITGQLGFLLVSIPMIVIWLALGSHHSHKKHTHMLHTHLESDELEHTARPHRPREKAPLAPLYALYLLGIWALAICSSLVGATIILFMLPDKTGLEAVLRSQAGMGGALLIVVPVAVALWFSRKFEKKLN